MSNFTNGASFFQKQMSRGGRYFTGKRLPVENILLKVKSANFKIERKCFWQLQFAENLPYKAMKTFVGDSWNENGSKSVIQFCA